MNIKCFAGVAALCWGCTTVPDGAPIVFQEAYDAIEKMDDVDADDYLPTQTELATERYDTAVDRWNDSQEDPPEATEASAIDLAQRAKATAEGATRLTESIRRWNATEVGFQDALAMLDESENPTVDVAVVASRSPFAKLRDSEIVSTVAYFETSAAEEAMLNKKEIDSMTAILEKDQNFQVILTGYADKRGADELNQELALNRAKHVASILKDKGIPESQIVVESAGASEAQFDKEHVAKMQFDRKVDARLILR